MNNHIQYALKTWYPKDHKLHDDSLHPAMGLAGEVGELINLHKKDMFKPEAILTREMELNELGDIWYYLRILAYQNHVNLEHIRCDRLNGSSTETALKAMATFSAAIFNGIDVMDYSKGIETFYIWLCSRLKQLECTIDELTALNWEKLKPGTERGDEWVKAWKE